MNQPTGHVELANGALGNERVVEEIRKTKPAKLGLLISPIKCSSAGLFPPEADSKRF